MQESDQILIGKFKLKIHTTLLLSEIWYPRPIKDDRNIYIFGISIYFHVLLNYGAYLTTMQEYPNLHFLSLHVSLNRCFDR